MKISKKNIYKNIIGLILIILIFCFLIVFMREPIEVSKVSSVPIDNANSVRNAMEMQRLQKTALNELDCQKLGKEKDENLILIEGKVVEAGVSPVEARDCLPNDQNCRNYVPDRTMYAVLKPNNINQQEIRVITKLESITEIMSKPSHLQKGESYKFCAHLIEETGAYKMNYLESLKPLNNKSQNINILKTNNVEEANCKKLGEENGRELHFVQGEVVDYGLNLPSAEDCFGDCENYVRLRSAYAEIKLLNMTVANKETIGIGMRKQPEDKLLKNPPRFEIGRKYSFCGKFYPKKEEYVTSRNTFYIEFLDTIEEMD